LEKNIYVLYLFYINVVNTMVQVTMVNLNWMHLLNTYTFIWISV